MLTRMKILLVRLDHMGDVVLTVPPVAASLRAGFPGARIDVLTTTAGEALLRDDPNIDHIVAFDPPWSVPPTGRRSTPKWDYPRRCLRFLVRQPKAPWRYDFIFYLSFSPWERLLTAWQGARRVGFTGPYRRSVFRWSARLLTDFFPFQTDRHVLDNGINLLEVVLPGVKHPEQTVLALASERREYGRRRLGEAVGVGRFSVLFHAGTHHSMKTWPFLNYLRVAHGLESEFSAATVFVGTPAEIHQQREYCHNAGLPPPTLLETPTVNDLVCVAASADLFIANDGGPMHIASALGVPTLAVFGPTDERIYGPRGARARVVREAGICGREHYPWGAVSCCRDTDRECLRLIRVETVLEAARDMLGLLEDGPKQSATGS